MRRKPVYFFNRQSGFTLVELLSVVAIIAILIAFLVPATGKAINLTKKTRDSNHLRQIALGYTIVMAENMGNTEVLTQANNLYEWAGELAKEADLNDPSFWINKEDPALNALKGELLPTYIGSFEHQQWALNPSFKKFPLSITVATGQISSRNPSTTPIVWTRGLKPDGTWASENEETPGVYGSKGGFIAFLDGHIEWYQNLSKNGGQLFHWKTRKPTKNIYEAIGPGAYVLDYQKKLHNSSKNLNSF